MSQNRYDLPSAIYRVPQRDRSGQRMLLIGAAIIGIGALASGGIWLLNGGTRSGEVPVIEPDARPMRVRPENPGGMQIDGQDDVILSGRGAGGSRRETLAPLPETPVPPVSTVPPRPIIVPAPAPAPAPSQVQAPAPAPSQVQAPTVPPPPVQAPAVREARPEEPAAPPAVSAPEARHGTGRATVQFSALPTEEAARSDWQRLQQSMPDLLGGRQPTITHIEREGRSFYRLRTGGFPDMDAAKAFCDRVRAAGGSCLVPAP